MEPFGFPIRGRFKTTHSLRFKVPFTVPPTILQPEVLPESVEATETHYYVNIRCE